MSESVSSSSSGEGERPGAHDGAGERDAHPHEPVEDSASGAPWRAAQHALLSGLERKGEVLEAVGDQVEPEQLGGDEDEQPLQPDGDEDGEDRGGTGGDEEERDLADVVEADPSFVDSGDDGYEVVVGQHHLRGLADGRASQRAGPMEPTGDRTCSRPSLVACEHEWDRRLCARW